MSAPTPAPAPAPNVLWQWVKLDEHTSRMLVPGGWVLRSMVTLHFAGSSVCASIDHLFIADAKAV